MTKIIQISIALILFSTSLFSQTCDTDEPSPSAQKEYFLKLQKVKTTRYSSVDFVLAPLSIHIIRDAAGNGGITINELNAALDRLNEQYIPAGIRFYTCGINYIDDDNLNQFEKNDDRSEAATYLVANTFNLFIVDNYTSGGSSSCGFAYYPHTSSWDMSVLKTSCVVDGTTLEHELGHAFDLRHTHQGDGSELVARPGEGKPYNCDTDGDGFCDTPADPKLTGWTISGTTCEVTNDQNLTDANGELFAPDGKNIMSYSPYKYCRSLFSPEQYAMMNYTIKNHADWTKMTCPSALVSDFDIENLVAVAGETTTLDNQSTGEFLSYSWTIAGANISSSTDRDPQVVFQNPGDYNVTLVATNQSGFEGVTKSIKVVALKEIPFTEDFSSGSSALDNYGVETNSDSELGVDGASGETDNGLYLAGANSSSPPYYIRGQSGEKPFLSNPSFNSKFVIPGIDGRNYSGISLTFDAKQYYKFNPSYGNFRVLVNDEVISSTYTVQSDVDEIWNEYTFDLSAYDGTVFSITLEGNSKYNETGINFDNINISGVQDTLSFTANITSAQTCEEIIYTAVGNATVTNYDWNFGDNAVPATATGIGPHTVIYNVLGVKTVELDGDQGVFGDTKTDYVTIAAGNDYEPTINISIAESLPICSGTSLEFTANTNNVGTGTVDWYIDNVKGSSGTTLIIDNITTQTKVVAKVKSNNPCSVDTSEITSNEIVVSVDLCTSTEQVEKLYSIYPNPTYDELTIVGNDIVNIQVSNLLGSKVFVESSMKTISLKSLPNGVYLVRIVAESGTYVKRIVKK